LPVNGLGGGVATYLHIGGVLQEEATGESAMIALETLMKEVHLHITRRVVLDADPACATNQDVLKCAENNRHAPLHRLLRSLATGTSAVPTGVDVDDELKAKWLVVPWVLSQIVHKLLLPGKSAGLQHRAAVGLFEDTSEASEKLFRFLCVTISKSNWAKRADLDEMMSRCLRFACDSYVWFEYDNLGYDRQGGPLRSKRFETVAQTWKEVTWPMIVRICGQEQADSLKAWLEKPRTTLTLQSYLPTENIYSFLDERWGAELKEAAVVSVKLGAEHASYSRDAQHRFTCRNEYYNLGDDRQAVSAAFMQGESARLEALLAEGDFLTLNNRNNLEQVDSLCL